jgi:hypothetical protein
MYKMDVYFDSDASTTANIEPLSIKREWMDRGNGSEYHCFPVSLSNRLGYAISFPLDISFVWDGDPTPNSESPISIISGKEVCWNQRGMGALTLNTNLIFKTDENTSLLTLPVPNQFIDGLQVFTSIISSSFFTGPLQIVLQATAPNKKITIPAGTPIATLVPISLKQFDDTKAIVHDEHWPFKNIHNSREYLDGIWKLKRAAKNEMSGSYTKAEDHEGNKIGKHEVKRLNFIVEKVNNG